MLIQTISSLDIKIVVVLSTCGIVLLFLLLSMYYRDHWSNIWTGGQEDDEEYEYVGGVYRLKPVVPPTVCTFYSEGMKDAIDKILKKNKAEPEVPAKSIEVDRNR